MSLLVEIGTILVAIIILYLLWKVLKLVAYLAVNSLMGIIIFFLLNYFLGTNITISLLSIGVVAIAGIPGVILVLVIHFLGLGF